MTTGDGITLADLRLKKKANTVTVWIAGDSEAADLLGRARDKVTSAERQHRLRGEGFRQQLEEAQAELERITEEVMPTLIKFKFKALSIPAWDAIIGEHVWTDEKKKVYRAEHPTITDEQMENMAGWDPETFPTALIAACCIEPALPKEELEEWLHDDEWNQTEIMTLFQSALEVNNSRRVVEVGKG